MSRQPATNACQTRRHFIGVQKCVLSVVLATLLVVGSVSLADSGPPSFTESFTTIEFQDSANTTAWWDTSRGVLELFPLPRSVGSVPTDFASDVHVSGDHAYVTSTTLGLQVVDITDPSSPVLVGSVTPFGASGVHVSGDHAYVVGGVTLKVFDVSNPSNPAGVGSLVVGGNLFGIDVSGDYAYIASGTAGLNVVDISDPSNPLLVGSVATPDFASGVSVSGNRAYVADNFSGVQVVSVFDPANPVITGSVDVGGFPWDITVAGDRAYVADGGFGLRVIDVSDPSVPVLAASLGVPGIPWGVQVSGDRAFLTTGDGGLQLIDISNVAMPTLISLHDTPDFAQGVFLSGAHAYVADGGSGLQIIQVFGNVDPAFVGSFGTPDICTGVDVIGDFAYVAGYSSGLLVMDISNPESPLLAGSIATPDDASTVHVSGNYAYVADNLSGLQVIDISDPSSPSIAGSVAAPGRVGDVFVEGNFAYITIQNVGIGVVDVSNPTRPEAVAVLDVSGTSLYVSGNHLFVAGQFDSRLAAVDISNPENPTLVGSLVTPGRYPIDVEVCGDYAYVADLLGLQIVDISDPTAPLLAGFLDTPEFSFGVDVAGNRAFLGDGLSGLRILDVSNPSAISILGTVETPDLATRSMVSGHYAFLCTNHAGLQVLRVSQGQFASTQAQGQSLSVDGLEDTIVRARLTTSQTDSVGWELSANGGLDYESIASSSSWKRIDHPGSDLSWRSVHVAGDLTINPSVSELVLEWFNDVGPIKTIEDVPDDQGGWVRIGFTRSGYDFAEETDLPVTGYQIFRRIEDPPLEEQILAKGTMLSPSELKRARLDSFDPTHTRRLNRRRFVLGREQGIGGEMPPGTWEVLSWVAAQQIDDYVVAVPTLGDSTEAGENWSVHVVTTHTTTPSIWFASAPDSGFSVDNIAPVPPQNLVFETPELLSWDSALEQDFNHHSVHGSETPDFDDTASFLGHTVEPNFDISITPFTYYFVTTSDFAGNESAPAAIQNETSNAPTSDSYPTSFALLPGSPNPFGDMTGLRFDLPTSKSVRLAIYDAEGRQVRILAEGPHGPGRHQVIWNGMNQSGREVAPGVYFIRLEAGIFVESRRLIRVR